MNISILNYNACNLASVYNAFYGLGAEVKIINDRKEIKKSDKLVIPGVGAAKSAIDYLHKKDLYYAVSDFLKSGNPILGICLGFQIFSENLYENGHSIGFGCLKGNVIEFKEKTQYPKFHIGWNKININQNLSNFLKIQNNLSFYFCHSFFLKLKNTSELDYGTSFFQNKFPAIVLKENFLGTQFHPEKSQTNGERILTKFISWKP